MTLPKELLDAARTLCREQGQFSISGFDAEWQKIAYHDADGPPEGEEGTFDAFAIMEAISDEFEFTEDGWDCFIADKK